MSRVYTYKEPVYHAYTTRQGDDRPTPISADLNVSGRFTNAKKNAIAQELESEHGEPVVQFIRFINWTSTNSYGGSFSSGTDWEVYERRIDDPSKWCSVSKKRFTNR